ncbi:MAG TPA: sulfotransferase [Acetobacteraceae bacterium]|jgi:hypothetical protein
MRKAIVGEAAPLRRWLRQGAGAQGSAPAPPLSRRRTAQDAMLARTAILILGSPRSGTTWLAKIFDSHPDVIYRHEPDELRPARPGIDPCQQLSDWIGERGLRAAAKRPFFRKSWLPPSRATIRSAMAYAISGASRLPVAGSSIARVALPDFAVLDRRSGLRAAVKLVNWDASEAARILPDTRSLFILRHPCGQVASMLAGVRQQRFRRRQEEPAMPIDVAAAATFAAARGVTAAQFHALPDAAKLAWSWLDFNEPVLDRLGALPNARIVRYEALCRRPAAVARELLEFADLAWNPQTDAFIGRSTQDDRSSEYFAVFRNSADMAERWRSAMSQADQEAVRSVVLGSRLAQRWPDLAEAG